MIMRLLALYKKLKKPILDIFFVLLLTAGILIAVSLFGFLFGYGFGHGFGHGITGALCVIERGRVI